MQRYNIISKLANLSISNLGKHKKIVIYQFSPLTCPTRLTIAGAARTPTCPTRPSPLNPIPSLYFRYRKNTGSPKKLLKNSTPIPHSLLSPPNPLSLPAKFFYLHLFHYFCTLNLKFDNSQIC